MAYRSPAEVVVNLAKNEERPNPLDVRAVSGEKRARYVVCFGPIAGGQLQFAA
jgi:hypothetical protein